MYLVYIFASSFFSTSNAKQIENFEVQKKDNDNDGKSLENLSFDKVYQDRLFVIKMYDTLNMKPSAAELERLAASGDRVAIMRHMIKLQKESIAPTEQMDERYDDDKEQEAIEREAKEQQAKKQEQEEYSNDKVTNEVTNEVRKDYRGFSLISDNEEPSELEEDMFHSKRQSLTEQHHNHATESAKEHPAKKHVRDMYMMLGRIDALL